MEVLTPPITQHFARRSPGPGVEAVERHFAHRGHGEEFEMEARWIARQIPAAATRILDIGCGIGALFPKLGTHRVVGMDYAHPGLRRTRDAYPGVQLACSDAGRLPFADASFDAITVQHVIEHIFDTSHALSEWSRVLCAGGMVVVITPNAEFREPAVFDDPTHLRLFDHQTLRFELECGRFIVEKVLTLGLPWLHDYRGIPGGWRLRRALIRNADFLAKLPLLRRGGQSLCCVARKKGGA